MADKVKGPQDIPDVVALHIASVMRDRKEMKNLEGELDRYLATLSNEEKREQKNKMREHLIDGRLVLESLLNRLLTSIG